MQGPPQRTVPDAYIELQSADIMIPSKPERCLVHGLSFRVLAGQNLLVTGPSGAGKSAIFRSLSGLWNTRNGQKVLCAPEGYEGARRVASVVPQQIYLPRTCLAEQVTYPTTMRLSSPGIVQVGSRGGSNPQRARAEVEDELLGLLSSVGLAYLVGRWGWWEEAPAFEDVLSLGEQQRLCMSRLFHSRPFFGVLDECTSAVSADMEEGLIKEASARGITVITLSQRLALPELHSQELRLLPESGGCTSWQMEKRAS